MGKHSYFLSLVKNTGLSRKVSIASRLEKCGSNSYFMTLGTELRRAVVLKHSAREQNFTPF